MRIDVYDSAADLADALAERVVRAIIAKPGINLGLPAGRTPIALYRAIVAASRVQDVDWSRVRTFNIDEFVVPASPAGSHDSRGPFERFIHRHLLDLVNVAPSNIESLNGQAPDLAAECDRYERAIVRAGGLDLLLLGIGANGHVGFNEPAASLHDRTHVATLAEATRHANAHLFGDDASVVPQQALTMGIGTIMDAREIVLVATGSEKAAAVTAMTTGLMAPQVPASMLQPHPNLTVILDRAAARR
ncbi:MAG TPA: glucosamine-6-phosphate deaminase [Vicinamibacterales bacterium]|nr:glucosamine-6-phosphate deaminase [Vicinamibacterales bacterium]